MAICMKGSVSGRPGVKHADQLTGRHDVPHPGRSPRSHRRPLRQKSRSALCLDPLMFSALGGEGLITVIVQPCAALCVKHNEVTS